MHPAFRLHGQIRARIAEMAGLSLGPLIEPGSVHDNLAIGSQFHVSAVHRTRRGPFEVDPFAVITASVAWTLELVLAGLPVGRAAQMSAARVNDKDAIGRAVHPNAVFLLPLGVHAESIIRGVANLENGGRFKERTRKEESKKSDEPGAEKRGDATPH